MSDAAEEWLRNIATNPDDAPMRLAYATWLYKSGHRNQAAVMRISVELCEIEEAYRRKSGYSAKLSSRRDECRDRLLELSCKVDSQWLVRIDTVLALPPNLPDLGRKAALSIVDFLGCQQWEYSGGRTAFVALEDCDNEIRDTSRRAVLVVRHSTDLLDNCLGGNSAEGQLAEQMEAHLSRAGVWRNMYDSSTSVIYPAEAPGFSIGLYFRG